MWRHELNYFLLTLNPTARAMDLAEGDKIVVITTYPFMEFPLAIHIKRIEKDLSKRK